MKYLAVIMLGLFMGTMAFANGNNDDNRVSGPLPADVKTCITTAITARENAIIAGHNAFNTSINTALETRKTALIAALDGVTRSDRMVARKNAWIAFSTSSKSAHTTMKSVRNSAYATYKTAATACRAEREIINERPHDVGMKSAVTSL
jgi:hypothetical protein